MEENTLVNSRFGFISKLVEKLKAVEDPACIGDVLNVDDACVARCIFEILAHDERYPLQDDVGNLALYFAALGMHKNLRVLLSLADRSKYENLTPSLAHVAAEYGQTEVVDVLADYDLSLDGLDANGNSPLYLSILTGHLFTAMAFVKRGADARVDNKGYLHSPFCMACLKGAMPLAKAIVAATDGDVVDEVDKTHSTALHNLVHFASYEENALKAGVDDYVAWLLEQGVDPRAIDDEGRTALDLYKKVVVPRFPGSLPTLESSIR